MLRILLGILLWANATLAFSQREAYDLMTYDIPSGYERSAQSSVVTFTKFNTDKTGFCMIGVYASRNGTNDLKKEFEAEWNDLVKRSKSIDVPANAQTMQTSNGWQVMMGEGTVRSQNPFVVALVTYVGFGKVVSVVTNINNEAFVAEMKSFLSTMSIAVPQLNAQVLPATQPSANNGDPVVVGMWRSACNDDTNIVSVTDAAGTGYSLIGITTGGLRTRHMVLLNDGTVCSYVSLYGLLDYQQQRAKDPNTWGVYHYSNGSGTLKFDGLSTPFPFTIQNGKIKYDGCVFAKLPWIENLQLNGTYTWEADPVRYKGNGMNAEPMIRFSSDGRFSDTGAVYYLNHIEHSSNSDYTDNKYGDGRYEIKQYTLSLYFDDGRTYHYTYLNFDGAKPDPEQLSIGLKFMKKKS